MASGQNTQLLGTVAAAYLTGGASLAAQGAAGAGGIAANGNGSSSKGKGSNFASGFGSIAAGNAGPSSADAMFGNPFNTLDTSGWNVTFGNESALSAEVGDRGGNTSAPTTSRVDGQPLETAGQTAAATSAAALPSQTMVMAGLILLLIVMARRHK